jgi:hypothetical protein
MLALRVAVRVVPVPSCSESPVSTASYRESTGPTAFMGGPEASPPLGSGGRVIRATRDLGGVLRCASRNGALFHDITLVLVLEGPLPVAGRSAIPLLWSDCWLEPLRLLCSRRWRMPLILSMLQIERRF